MLRAENFFTTALAICRILVRQAETQAQGNAKIFLRSCNLLCCPLGPHFHGHGLIFCWLLDSAMSDSRPAIRRAISFKTLLVSEGWMRMEVSISPSPKSLYRGGYIPPM